jgi:hypothetical protein
VFKFLEPEERIDGLCTFSKSQECTTDEFNVDRRTVRLRQKFWQHNDFEQWGMLQRMNVITNECYNEQFHQ